MARVVKITFLLDSGKELYTNDAETIEKIMLSLPKLKGMKETTNVDILRRKYRVRLRALAKNLGYPPEYLHEVILKPKFEKLFTSFPEYFIEKDKVFSTANLNLQGMQAVLENLEHLLN